MLKKEDETEIFKLHCAYESPGGAVKRQVPDQAWVGLRFSKSSRSRVKLMLADMWATLEDLPVVPREELVGDSYSPPPFTPPPPRFASNLLVWPRNDCAHLDV